MKSYLHMIGNIINNGDRTVNRTGIDTLSVFGYQFVHDMKNGFPLLTTKKIHYKSVVGEMLWMLRGETNIRTLLQDGVTVWSDWPYQAYVKSLGPKETICDMKEFERRILADDDFAKKFGECGPIYGHQWRNWRTPQIVGLSPRPQDIDGIRNFVNDYKKQTGETVLAMEMNFREIDQLRQVINTIRLDPFCRRNIMTAWNPADIKEMTVAGVPPCHMMVQFKCRPISVASCIQDSRLRDRQLSPSQEVYYLDLHMYQRSADAALGVPFNIAGYAFLLELLAKITGHVPGRMITSYGDLHIYVNHLDGLKKQATRLPRDLPVLNINRRMNDLEDLENCKVSDLTITDYNPHEAIAFEVAV